MSTPETAFIDYPYSVTSEMMCLMIGVLTNETPFRYAHAEIRTRVLVICGPTRYQLDHEGAQIVQ